MGTAKKSGHNQYFYEINFMRAFIILTIVFGHMLNSVGYTGIIREFPNETSAFYKMIPQFINGNSALFVFVSGFLFYSIFSQTSHIKKYCESLILRAS